MRDSVRILDARRWNVHNGVPGRIAFDDHGTRLLCDDQPVAVLHATSKDDGHIHFKMVDFVLGGRPASVRLKLFRYPELSRIQFGLLTRFLERNEREMSKHLIE